MRRRRRRRPSGAIERRAGNKWAPALVELLPAVLGSLLRKLIHVRSATEPVASPSLRVLAGMADAVQLRAHLGCVAVRGGLLSDANDDLRDTLRHITGPPNCGPLFLRYWRRQLRSARG